MKTLTCRFCGASGLKPRLTGKDELLTLPTHLDPEVNVVCPKSGSFWAFEFDVDVVSANAASPASETAEGSANIEGLGN